MKRRTMVLGWACALLCGVLATLTSVLGPWHRPDTDVDGEGGSSTEGQERGPGFGDQPQARDAEALAEFVRDRIRSGGPKPGARSQKSEGADSVTFDPVTLVSLVGLVIQLFQACKERSILAQQRAVQRRPDGTVARRLEVKLQERMKSEHPDSSPDQISHSVASAMSAFRTASREELLQLHADSHRLQTSPMPIDLFDLAEELSVE